MASALRLASPPCIRPGQIAACFASIRRLLPLALPVAAAFLAAGAAVPEDAPAPGEPKPKGEVSLPDEEITYSAAAYYRDHERDAYVFSGSAWVRFRTAKLEADSIVYFRGRSALYAEGSVRLTESENQTTCDVFHYDLKAGRGYAVNATVCSVARPGVRIPKVQERREERQEPAPDDFFARRFRDPYGVYLDPRDDPQARSMLVMRADRIVQHGPLQFSAHDARVTAEDQANPTVYVRVNRMDYYLREMPDPKDPDRVRRELHRTVMRGITLMAGPVPLFWLPGFTYRTDGPSYFMSGSAGQSTRWGWFAMGRFGLDMPSLDRWWVRPKRVYADLDYRSARGVGGGIEVDYSALDAGRGTVRGYCIDESETSAREKKLLSERQLRRDLAPLFDGRPRRSYDENLLFQRRRQLDNAGPPRLFPEPYPDGFRGEVEFQHHQGFGDLSRLAGWNLDLRYSSVTDRGFLYEYERRGFKEGPAPEALAAVRKIADDWGIELAVRADPLEFEATPPRSVFRGAFTEYMPQGRADLMPTHVGFGFFLDGTLSAGRMARTFDRALIDQDDIESGRLHLGLTLSRPIHIGPVTVKPYAGSSQTLYDDSRDSDAKYQSGFLWGATVSTRAYGTFDDVEVPWMGIHGLRHSIEPRFEYHAVSGTSSDPAKIHDFDEVDDLRKVSRISFCLDQRLQTRGRDCKPGSQAKDYAALILSLDFFPDHEDRERLLDGDRLDALRIDVLWNIVSFLRIDADMRIDAENGKVDRAKWGIRVDPGGQWYFGVQQRLADPQRSRGMEGYNQLRAYVACQISEKWRVRVEQSWQLRHSLLAPRRNASQRVVVDRDFGLFEVSVSYSHSGSDKDSVSFVDIRPRIPERNLVLPSDRLLVPKTELAPGGIMGEEGVFGLMPLGRPKAAQPAEAKAPKGPLKYPPPPPGARLHATPPPEHSEDMDALPGGPD